MQLKYFTQNLIMNLEVDAIRKGGFTYKRDIRQLFIEDATILFKNVNF